MPTINQLIRHEGKKGGRRKRPNKTDPILCGCPQKRGTCVYVGIQTPKKPNSAKRKIAKVKLSSTGKTVLSYIVGQGHNLQVHSEVLIRGKGPKDLPANRYRIVRGALGCEGVVNQKQSRSKYGKKMK